MAMNHGYAIDPGFRGLFASLGVDHQGVLRRSGLPADLFDQPSARVDTEQFFAFAHAIEDSVDDPLFPIRFVDAVSAEWLSPAVFAALRSPNLATAAARLARYKPLIAPVRLHVENGDTGLVIAYEWLEGDTRAPPLLSGSEALFLVKLARIGTRHPVHATAVTMRELPGEHHAYEDFMGCQIHTGDRLSVRFSPEDAARPFLTDNSSMWAALEPQLGRQLAELERASSIEARTRAVVMDALPEGPLSIETAARQLALSSRTLQRKLQQEGTNFKAVVHRTREDLARHYVGETQLSFGEIAYLLGFEEAKSFFRAFRAWTGTTPQGLRQSLRSEP